ncbi:YggS family pyridoxal phosphate-dependent enzyme [Frigoribacterium faeni]|uniref:YggS family pyridoxal phosphate-dependent enzyme n=1 Tax=Frigoribacterium TaxID=96492 RepID=UPI001FAD847C|nr:MULTISPECIES: YggS family pyridoxal phosphate-dependent enzyme [Frigoribacterium]MCJ0700188.1 YggS family pyridoxal phosphate-dependent enzyme [Frigoribacterium faeni]MDY0890903.1 YggS family pyridoxal phosphate-dependent enzyme [Frigoribacterium sp. CFBP9030]
MSVEPAVGGDLEVRLARVAADVGDAVRAAGRRPDEVTTIVVTKFHPAELVSRLYDLGVRDVGENRHQEAQVKAADLSGLEGLRWHFVGQLQSKKARQARRYAAAVHSLDRASVVDALAADDGALVDGFVQVNLTDDPGRGGVAPADVEALAERIVSTPGLRLRGVMAVAPLDEPARPAFARLRVISDRVRSIAPEAGDISAGMSGDFAEAVAEGATHLRIGTAITGMRPPAR